MSTKLFFIAFLGLIILATGLTSCARKAIPEPTLTLQEPISVVRDMEGNYHINFEEEGEYSIYSGKKQNDIDWETPLVVINGKEAMFTQFPENQRMYFGIIGPDSIRHIVSERRIALEGASNFRDIGGLKTKDNRMVNWGMIFRSNNLAGLSSKDLAYLNKLKIKTVGDFRYPSEADKDPNRLPNNVAYFNYPIGGKEGVFYQKLKKQVLKEGLRRKEAKKEFIKVMAMFADSAAHDFKPVMDMIASDSNEYTPILYHCSGGKDRTGYMTMVILATLGVDKETIRNEYLMSNYYRYKTNKKIARKARLVGIDPETLTYILVVQDDYFDAVFDVIENKYKGIDNYLLVKYDISAEDRQRIIEKYTSPIESVTVETPSEITSTDTDK